MQAQSVEIREIRELLLSEIQRQPAISAEELAERTHLPLRKVRPPLIKLVADGHVKASNGYIRISSSGQTKLADLCGERLANQRKMA